MGGYLHTFTFCRVCANSGPSTHPFANSGNSELHPSAPNPMDNPPIHAILHPGHPLPSNGTINLASHLTYLKAKRPVHWLDSQTCPINVTHVAQGGSWGPQIFLVV